jgi:hypothetical protein
MIVTETETKKLNEKTYIWRYKDGDGDGLAWLGVVALWRSSPENTLNYVKFALQLMAIDR